MNVITELCEAPWERAAVAIGKFEGLHIGHQKLIQEIVEKRREGYETAAFTFDVSPRIYFGQGQGQLFTSRERRHIFESRGLAWLIECPFAKVHQMEAEQFIEEVLLKLLHTGYLAVGSDFCFGRERRGNVQLLERYARQGAFCLHIMDKVTGAEGRVSSTRIRECLEQGGMEKVSSMLGFPFFLEGCVVEGNRLGRTWGIPTANVVPGDGKLLPPNGVYCARLHVDGHSYNGITNLGSKPTIGNHYQKGAETFIYDFQGDLYGREVRVELLHFKRSERKFESIEQLVKQLKKDVESGREYFAAASFSCEKEE